MAMAHQSSDRLTSADSTEVLNVLLPDINNNNITNPNVLTNKDLVTVAHFRDGLHQSGVMPSVVDSKTSYSSQAQFYDEAHKQDSFLPYVNAEGLENGFHGIYNETVSLGFHGFGPNPQLPHRPYALVSSHLPPIADPSWLPNARHFPTSDSSYHQPSVPLNIAHVTSNAQFSHLDCPINLEQQVDRKRFGLRPNYLPQSGLYGGGSNFFGSSGKLCSSYQGFDGSGADGVSLDWSKHFSGKSSLFQVLYPAASPKRVDSLEFPSNDIGMASFQKRSFQGIGSCSGSGSGGYTASQSDQNFGCGSVSTSSLGINGQNWPKLDEARRSSCIDFSCSCNVTLDTLSEHNRGPRAFKPKSQIATKVFIVDSSKNGTNNGITNGLYNRQNFVTDYEGAKFFVIKSYSEDNVHKSIKYGVWASTPIGNKKLDTAYHEAKAKQGTFPVFLLFSVNASAQFCGVAEMVGPVDFDKSLDYWLQDKWSGQFPVKWYIIKDAPNSQFRHILLENNDNKPVTNSKDTQEVEFEQGIEMLNIFKNYESHSSILDDFYFYEERQKAMQERKARQLTSLVASPNDLVGESQNLVSLPNVFAKKLSKSFAEALLLNENEKAGGATGKVLSTAGGGLGG
ncbi:uncharacterized protein LOC111287734 [Durio zibethinus]|uniref:YTH domain-containing family protein n=1 Tax=Durio zibethinus TaxID=66656 RepID=A0A6P5Y2A6_DURZI|nr:uncharacterized protein LOC111287734 [Durio zibethinus]